MNQSGKAEAVSRLIGHIQMAFAGVTLETGIGLFEADSIDDRDDAETRTAKRLEDEKEDWSLIPVERLNHLCGGLCFFDASGMRFHLPAYMIAELRGTYDGWVGLEAMLASEGDSYEKFVLFSTEQRLATREFLIHLLDDPGSSYFQEEIRRSLETRWKSSVA